MTLLATVAFALAAGFVAGFPVFAAGLDLSAVLGAGFSADFGFCAVVLDAAVDDGLALDFDAAGFAADFDLVSFSAIKISFNVKRYF